MLKREILKNTWKDIKGATVIIVPKKEVVTAYSEDKIIELFKKYNLPSELFEYESSSIAIYKTKDNLFSISISKRHGEEFDFNLVLDTIVEKFSTEVIAYMPCNLPPVLVDRYLNKEFTIDDLRFYAEVSSSKELADKLGVSKSLISHINSGNKQISIELLKTISVKFPLLDLDIFWGENSNVK